MNGLSPNLYPGILSEIIDETSPLYFAACFAGITASPGESIAGTTSPAPFGPGTDKTPDAYFLGTRPGLGILDAPVSGFLPRSLDC